MATRSNRVLMAAPRPFDGFVEQTKRVSPTCLIHVERNRYSVPASFANRPVSVRVYADRLVVAAEGQFIAEHRRIIERSHRIGPHRLRLAPLPECAAAQARAPCATAPRSPICPTAFKRLQAILLTPFGRRPGNGGDPGLGAAPRRRGDTDGRRIGLRSRRSFEAAHLEFAGPVARHAPRRRRSTRHRR